MNAFEKVKLSGIGFGFFLFFNKHNFFCSFLRYFHSLRKMDFVFILSVQVLNRHVDTVTCV